MFIPPFVAALTSAASTVGATLAAAAPTITAAAGVATAIGGLTSKAPKLQAPSTPTAPNPKDSLAQAQADSQSRQKARLATGGQTIYTSPTGATVNAGNLQMHQLLGA